MNTLPAFSRRSTIQRLAGAGVAITAGAVAPDAVLAQPATPASLTGHPLVGTWRVTAAPPGPQVGLASYHAGGTMTFVTPTPFASPPDSGSTLTWETPAYGVWEATGERSAAMTGIHLYADDQGAYQGTLTFWGTIEIDDSGDAYRYTGAFEIADATGTVLIADQAATAGIRLRVEMPAARAATPEAAP